MGSRQRRLTWGAAIGLVVAGFISGSVSRAAGPPVEMRFACVGANGLVFYAQSQAACTSAGRRVRWLHPGPASLCVRADRRLRTVSARSTCRPGERRLTLPQNTRTSLCLEQTGSRIVRWVAQASQCAPTRRLAGRRIPQRVVFVVNHAPSDLSVSNLSVAENQPAGTDVGTLAGEDVDRGATFAFSLATGTGGEDNGAFQIDGTRLLTQSSFDFEAKSSYSLLVQVRDQWGMSRVEPFTVTVTDVVEPACANGRDDDGDGRIDLADPGCSDAADTNETDPPPPPPPPAAACANGVDDDGDGLIDMADPGCSSPADTNESNPPPPPPPACSNGLDDDGDGKIDFPADPGCTSPADTNETDPPPTNLPPTDIALTSTSVAENQPAGTPVGTLSATDSDVGDTHTFALVAGTGDADNGSFQITGATLQTNAIFDFETKDSYSIRIRATDSGSATFEEPFTITVTDVSENAPPTAVDDATTVAEDSGATTIDVLANDTDPDGGPNAIIATSDPANGTVVIAGGGSSLTYAPDANYCNAPPGTTLDTFTYTLNGGSSATVTVTVTCVDDNPTAVDDSATVPEDAPATAIDVLANDTDPEGGAITIGSVGDPANGTAAITGGGTSLTYEPDPDYCNTPPGTTPETFTYTVNGGSTATVSVTVTCVPDAATAVNDTASVLEDSAATAIDVLANDTDPDGTATIQSATQPANGVVAIAGDGLSVLYQPNAGYCNTPPGTTLETFTYTLSGGSSATVTVTVTCVVDNPTAVNDTATVAEDAAATAIDVLANDTDPDDNAVIQSVSDPANGTAVITGGGTGLTYQPDPDYCNTPPGTTLETFTYTLNGGSSATVTVTVTCVVDNPTAVNDTASVLEDAAATAIDVLANDSDPDDNAAIQSVSDPANGTAAITGGGTGLTYQPDANFCGSDPFTYTLNGGSVATVSMTVTCVNDAPSFTKGADQTVAEDAGPQTVAGWATAISRGPANESGQAVTFEITANTNSSLFSAGPAVSATGALTYTPAPNQNGTATITLRITDDGGTANGGVNASATQTFVITVTAVNDAPVAQAKSFSAQANMEITGLGGLLTGVTDADTGVSGCTPSFTVASVGPTTSPAGGTISNVDAAAGTFDFDPPPGATGNVTFSFTVQDTGCPGTATSASATITVNVAGPVIWFVDDSAPAGGDGRLSSPFNTLAGAAAVDAANHRVFLYAGTYATGIALNSGEWLVGQGVTGFASFDALMGITPPAGTIARPSVGTGTVTVQGTVTLNTGALVRALALSTGASAAVNDTAGAITGVDVAQTSVATTTGTGIALSDVGGTITLTGLTTSGGSGATLTGANAAATFAFTAVAVSSGANPGVSSTGGGTLTITGAANTLTSNTGTALNVTNTTIGASGLTFRSISANGATNGIVLNNTGATGNLVVTGNGGACSSVATCTGGAIQNTTNHGISLTNTTSPSLARMAVQNVARNGIDGITVTNFTLADSFISNTGTAGSGQYEENAIAFVDRVGFEDSTVSGSVSVTGTTITQPRRNGLMIETWNGTISTLTVTGNTFTGGTTTSDIADAVHVFTQGSATTNASLTTATISNNTISGFRFFNGAIFVGGNGIRVAGGAGSATNVTPSTMGTSGQPIVISGNSISGVGSNAIAFSFNGQAGSSFVNVTNNGTAVSPMTNMEGLGISVFFGAGDNFTGTSNVTGNFIGTVGPTVHAGSSGIGVQLDAGPAGGTTATPTGNFTVTNNTISGPDGTGIIAIGINNAGDMDVDIRDNSVTADPFLANRSAIRISQNNTTSPAICMRLSGNSTTGGSGVNQGIGIRRAAGLVFGVVGLPAGSTATPAFEAYINSQNPSGGGTDLISQTSGFTSCTLTP